MQKQKQDKSSNSNNQKQAEPQYVPKPITPIPPVLQPRNSGHAAFSKLAKQAESLSNGDNSVIFNDYNNNIVFRSNRVNLNDCLSIDAYTKSVKNVNDITFKDNSVIAGISPGYTINNQGAKVVINDETLALSTAFGYDVMKRIEQLESRLRTMERN